MRQLQLLRQVDAYGVSNAHRDGIPVGDSSMTTAFMFVLIILSLLTSLRMVIMVMTTVHEEMHERAKQNKQKWQCSKQVLLMPYNQVHTKCSKRDQYCNTLRAFPPRACGT
jgi:NADH:ubiquinone oxidoreductase subunit 5 (subunit L)/multisubunit Na+/H+ antiporter MnhA subunit